MKTILSLLALLPIALFAQSTAWYTANPDAATFQISTAEDLRGLASLVNSPIPTTFSGKTIKLMWDIDLGGVNFAPIGNNSTLNCFRGVFDGQGYGISGLLIEGNYKYAGLFGCICENAKIKDLNVVASKIKTTLLITTSDTIFIGGLAGYYNSTQPIENSSVVADSITVTSTRLAFSGGLVGYVRGNYSSATLSSFTISNSYSTANVVGSCSGGLVGVGSNIDIIISNSHTEGNINGRSSDLIGYSGGLIGAGWGSISNSYTTGNISGVCSGGLVGYGSPSIENSYSTGNVGNTIVTNGNSYSGGLVGYGATQLEIFQPTQ